MRTIILVALCVLIAFVSYARADSIHDDYLSLATLFKESGEYQKAIEVLRGAKSSKSDRQLLTYLGRLEFLSGQVRASLKTFTQIKKKSWQDYLYLGLIYEDLGNKRLAIENYLKSINLKENSIASFRLGKIHRTLGNYQQAQKYFQKVIKLDPSIRLANYYLGECLYKLRRYKSAYTNLAKAARFYPEVDRARQLVSLVKEKLGKEYFLASKKNKAAKRRKVKLKLYEPKIGALEIKVGLGQRLNKFSFFCASSFTITNASSSFKGEAEKFYSLTIKGKRIVLQSNNGKRTHKSFTSPIVISSSELDNKKGPFYVLDVAYGDNDFWSKQLDRGYRGNLEVILNNKELTLVNTLSLEEYLYGVLAAEISAKADPQALMAQAVAARTIAFRNLRRHRTAGFNLCADVHCQVYQGVLVETPATKKAVDETKGKILTYNGKPIESFYHANCGGCLRDDLFGPKGYLVSKIDSKNKQILKSNYNQESWFLNNPATFCSDKSVGKYRWQRAYDSEDFLIAFGFEIKDLVGIVPKEKDSCFHYNEIELIFSDEKVTLRGDLGIRNYFDKLRSSAFWIDRKVSAGKGLNMLIFWGAGFGHGVGLCQQGAIAMADEGFSYQQILKHYYPNATLENNY